MKFLAKIFSILLIVGMIFSFVQPGSTLAKEVKTSSTYKSTDKIEALLLDKFSEESSADFIVEFVEQADLSQAYEMNWEDRGWYVYTTLTQVADKTQASAKAILGELKLEYQSFFTGNELYVRGGNLVAAQTLAELPEVKLIRATRTYMIDPVVKASNPLFSATWAGDLLANHLSFDVTPNAITDWGITDSKADQFWSNYGVQGEGIVVANIDTGVDYTHIALNQNYKCLNNPSNPECWLDPGTQNCTGLNDGPCDTIYSGIYHGTHTMGTMVAENDPALTYIAGMAPNAQWIACMGCPSGSCPDVDLNTCADWIVAPNGNPSARPNIVNNSWGGPGGDNWYLSKVNAWRASGIFPAFSAGNYGSCNSLGSPGDYQESFGSASHQITRAISSFSSKGPSSVFGHDPYTKPNISAPGEEIWSAQPGNSWAPISGTSMASPHSAGAVALLWSCNPSLIGQIDQTFQILQDTADAPPAGSCGAPPDGQGNNTFGYGYLNMLEAGRLNCGDLGFLEGVVTSDSLPVQGATVTASGALNAGSTIQAITDPNGHYDMTLLVGTYDVTATHPEYITRVVSGVEITADETTTLDIVMQPRGHVSGHVTDNPNGFPLVGATVSADDGTTTTTDDTGLYELYLDPGSYSVTAQMTDYASQSLPVEVVSGEEVTLDFTLLAAISVVPDPLHAHMILGQTGSLNTTATNNMAEPYPFEFLEFEGAVANSSGTILASGGPDPFGYTYIDSNEPGGARYEWVDATDGIPLVLSDDAEGNVTLPFVFDFYGTDSTAIRVGNNGGVIFNSTTADLYAGNEDLATTTTNNLIVPFWDDIDSDTGDVYYKVVGEAPYRQMVIEWYNRPHYSNVGNATFELILYETTNNIKYQYLDVVFGNISYDYGASATVGIRQQGTNFLKYSYNQPVIQDNLAICFNYPGSAPCDGGDVLWLGESIPGGAIPGNSGTLSWMTFFTATEASGIYQPGDYYGTLRLQPLSVGQPTKLVPVIMTVEPSTVFGQIEGIVTSDRPGGALGADILIEASDGTTVTLTTDPDTGYYSFWLEEGSYDVTASAAGYVSQTLPVQIVGQQVTTRDFELLLDAAGIVVDPNSFEVTLQLGESVTDTMNIANTGLQLLDFELFEFPGGFTPSGTSGQVTISGGPDPFGYTFADSNEPGGPLYRWIDATDGTPLDLTDDGEVNVTLPFNFNFYGVTSTAIRVGNNGGILFNDTTSDLTYMNSDLSTSTVNNLITPFWDDMDDESGNVYYKVVGTAPYRQMVIEWFNRPHFNGVGNATYEVILFETWNNIKFQYQDVIFGDPTVNNGLSATVGIRQQGVNFLQYSYNQAVLEDNMSICFNFPGSIPCDVVDVPWVFEQPISGTVPLDGSMDVELTFDSSGVVDPGIYTATLLVQNNDPIMGIVNVPLRMNVLPSEDIGLLEGNITSSGYCDDNANPLVATLTIESSGGITWTLTTDANGYYHQWLPADNYLVTASAPNHLDASGAVVVVSQHTTVLDLALRSIEPCMEVVPIAITVTLPAATQFTETLAIINHGAGDLTWELHEAAATLNTLDQDVIVKVPTITTPKEPIASRNGSFGFPARSIPMHIGKVSAEPINVLIVTPDVVGGGDISLLLSTLAAFPDLNVTVWNGTAGTPTVADMQAYDVVFVGNDVLWTSSTIDKTILSNRMADYIDAGGKILVGNFIWSYDDWGFGGGRFIAEDYSPYEISSTDIWAPANLGTFDVDSPLMAGITNVTDAFNHQDPALSSHGIWVASWNDGENYVATAPNVVGLNQEYFNNADFGGQTGELLHNALLYLGGAVEWTDVPWVTEVPTSGVTLADSTFNVDVVFNTTGLTIGECYTASLGLVHNDAGQDNPFFIPLKLCVVVPEYGVNLEPESSAGFGLPGETITYTLRITNTGNVADTIELSTSNVKPGWVVTMPVSNFALLPGQGVDAIVRVTIPAGLANGDFDTFTLTATSRGDRSEYDEVEITTTVEYVTIDFFLPIIMKH